MTPSQRIHLMADLWPNAAQAQHWPVNDRLKRVEVLGNILGRQLNSANDIVTNDDFTKVKNALLHLADSLLQIDPCATRREKVQRQLKCLALYPLEQPRGLRGADHYICSVIEDIAHRAGYERATFSGAPLEDLLQELKLPDLDRLVMTLDNRLHHKTRGMRNAAGHTLHDMFTRANVPCHCLQCVPRKRLVVQVPEEEVPASNRPF